MSWFKISSAVVVGNLVSWTIIGVIGFFFSFLIMEATVDEVLGGHPTFNASLNPVRQSSTGSNVSPRDYLTEQARQDQQRLKQNLLQETDDRTDSAVIRTKRRMCKFSILGFTKDNSEQSRKHRDAACSRYRASLN